MNKHNMWLRVPRGFTTCVFGRCVLRCANTVNCSMIHVIIRHYSVNLRREKPVSFKIMSDTSISKKSSSRPISPATIQATLSSSTVGRPDHIVDDPGDCGGTGTGKLSSRKEDISFLFNYLTHCISLVYRRAQLQKKCLGAWRFTLGGLRLVGVQTHEPSVRK